MEGARFRLNTEEIFTVRIVQHRNRLPGEAVLKVRLDGALVGPGLVKDVCIHRKGLV